MDFARHEYANNPTEQKKESCNKAVTKFKEQSYEVRTEAICFKYFIKLN